MYAFYQWIKQHKIDFCTLCYILSMHLLRNNTLSIFKYIFSTGWGNLKIGVLLNKKIAVIILNH